MDVLLIGNFLTSPGYRSVGEDLALRLTASRWSVVTASEKPGRLPRLVDMLGAVWLRRRQYSVAQVDVYSGAALLWAVAVCWVLRRAGKPYVLTLRGGNLPRFARRWPGQVGRLLGSAAVVTMPSRYLLEKMRPYRSDLFLLPNPLDLQSCRFRPREQADPSLVWMRAFHALYNPYLAVKVVERIAAEFPEVRLAMVGPDNGDGSWQRTQDMIAQSGLISRIDLPGGVPKAEVPSWLAKGDIFINTTEVDNTPVSILEAMACGLCVVSTNVGGIPYLLEDEKDALLVPPNDPEAMTMAVRRILIDPGLAERLSRNARRKAEQFDWTVILPQWETLLTAVAEDHQP